MANLGEAVDDARIDLSVLVRTTLRKLPRIILVTLLCLALAFVYLMFQPRLYASSASILVEPRSNAYTRPSTDQAQAMSPGDVGVVSSQIELIKSRDTLLSVIDQLGLRSNDEFNGADEGLSPVAMVMSLVGRPQSAPTSVDETVLGNLVSRLSVVQERDSRLISVIVRATDPKLAADIANAIAYAHVTRRAQLSLADTADASSWLGDEIVKLRGSVQSAETAVADFKVANDLYINTNNSSLLDQQITTLSNQVATAQERRNGVLSRAALIRGMIEERQPIESLADVRDSVVVQRLGEEKARLQGELAQRSATLLDNHPTMRALRAQIGELDRQMRLEGERVAASLEAQAQVEDELVAKLQADLAALKQTASTATIDTVTLDGLEREAKAQRDLLEAYLLRYNEASSRADTNSALPDVRVVSEAAPSVTPASPKTSMIMMAVGFVAFGVQLGAVVFGELLSGRAIVPVRRSAMRPEDLAPSAPAVAAPIAPTPTPPAVTPPATPPAETPAVPPAPAPSAAVGAPAVSSLDEVRSSLKAIMDDDAPTAAAPAAASATEADEAKEVEEALPPVIELPPVAPVSVSATHLDTTEDEPHPARVPGLLRYDEMLADMVLGRTNLLLLVDPDDSNASESLADSLVEDALSRGLSVALIDAGTRHQSDQPGMVELSTEVASFGDVVQKSPDNTYAEVVWGQGTALDLNSARPATLAEALGDIYEVVIVLIGRADRDNMLGKFAKLGGRIVLVAGADTELDQAIEARKQLAASGLHHVELAALPATVAA